MSSGPSKSFRVLRVTLAAAFAAATAGVLALAAAYLYLAPQLPSIESLKDVRLQVPLRIYTADRRLIAEFGEKRRAPVRYDQVPDRMLHAFLAAEDDRFFSHPGVDYQGLLRAALHLIRTGEKGQGGSTITMQVARNFFLSSEKTYLRKLNEIFLALKIERELSKKEILELYLNKIYLGHRAYGVQAAAQVYYGKRIDELTVAETAMIAGLPKAPSRYNPIVNPERAVQRRNYVLGRMRELRYLGPQAYREASKAPVSASVHGLNVEVTAPYLAEMVRAEMVERFGTEAYTAGYEVVTTIRAGHQEAANEALRETLLEYDRRHGYRGPERHLDQVQDPTVWDRALDDTPAVGTLMPGLVVEVQDQAAQVYLGRGREIHLDWEALSWAQPYIDANRRGPEPETAGDVLSRGALIRVEHLGEGRWRLAQVPEVSGALVALAPRDGAVTALVGGFDYYRSKFNRVTQARRQPGSNFKPFIYSAALSSGFTPASLINDAPVVFEDPALESTWRPENYSGRFYGPTRLREALVHSRNLVSIRLLRAIGVDTAIGYIQRFGFQRAELPRNLSLALGSATVTPLKVVSAYSVFANLGFRVAPHFIREIRAADGRTLYRAEPAVACAQCDRGTGGAARRRPGPLWAKDRPPRRLARRAISPQIAYLMNTMMRDVIRRGTGRRARVLGRDDLAGKTGTTNDQRDAWFSGFNHAVVATAWVGFDQVRPLGRGETGSRAALPMWIRFMDDVLKGVPERALQQPPGLVTVRIDPETGLLAGGDTPNAVFETFRADMVPKRVAEASSDPGEAQRPSRDGNGIPEQIF
ncbi:MAG: penicillin-binding protein 1A [Gammaproteobacteria bacterium]|nr:penicillin-binding protein 1A [Gammaproteobacteria bacterium]NIR97138.1 penicillin-binding protein 1A [Gammaproteobacteria bacterium]NIT62836.1 penicillin-binding protein 1A [Gammaproteobacteria bacterium]NIV19800.1 PBP1A family penicillin-binding protein [Gammaproteobacteria bacterium]NIX11333.1 PBP1A family penicillin-binding protein [Gammaproteobacteria bacterium]